MIPEIPLEELDALKSHEATQWFDDQARTAKYAVFDAVRAWFPLRGTHGEAAALDALAAAQQHLIDVQDQQRLYFVGRKERRQQAHVARTRQAQAEAIARHGAVPLWVQRKQQKYHERQFSQQYVRAKGGGDLSQLPEGIRGGKPAGAAHQLRARTVIRIDTGNIEYRLRKERKRDDRGFAV